MECKLSLPAWRGGFEKGNRMKKDSHASSKHASLFSGNNRARTCDPLLVRQVLSQLSYASE